MNSQIIQGDALAVLKTLETNSVDSIVSDPPSSIGFMGMEWDKDKGGRDQWIAWLSEIMTEARRVLKPGGHVLIWSLPRTSHYTAMALEDAGYSIRDCVSHLFGSGMPKSLNVSKVLQKQGHDVPDGIGTGLKPSHELWWLARSPLAEDSISANVLEWGVGGLAIDACRIGHNEPTTHTVRTQPKFSGILNNGKIGAIDTSGINSPNPQGRWPANLILSHTLYCQPNGLRKVKRGGGKPIEGNERKQQGIYSLGKYNSSLDYGDSEGNETVEDWICTEDCPVRLLDEQGGYRKSGATLPHHNSHYGGVFGNGKKVTSVVEANEGYVSRYFMRFFYSPKASKRERNLGCEGLTDGLLDSVEIVMVQLSQYSKARSQQWENEDLQVTLRVDTAQSPPRVIDVSGIANSNALEWNTFLFGNDTTAPFLMGCKFTTVTKTRSTTQSKTLNWLTHLLTNVSIVDVNSETVNGGNHAGNAEMSNLSILSFTNEESVYLPGVGNVASQTQWKISVSVKPKFNNIDFGTMKAGGSGKPVNGTGLPLPRGNGHPCVKPISLMRYLVRMITPPGGIVLDCFGGSGTTALACIAEGFDYLIIEQEPAYIDIINARVNHALTQERTQEPHVGEWQCVPECPVRMLGEMSGERKSGAKVNRAGKLEDNQIFSPMRRTATTEYEASEGTAARYFMQFAPDAPEEPEVV